MESLYGVVIGVILLFPWFLVGVMVVGSFLPRIMAVARGRHRPPGGHPLPRRAAPPLGPSPAPLKKREALPHPDRAHAVVG